MKTQNQIIRIIADYFRNKKEISAVYLFGSYAHGNPGPASDVDIGLLFGSHNRAFILDKLDRYNLEIARMLRKDIHLVALNLVGELLLKQVFLKGRCILINKTHHLAAFKMTSFSKIAEFGPYKSNFEKAFTHKLANG